MDDAATANDPDAEPRNLLLCTFDQLRGDWCDPTAPIVDLPNIQALAGNGWSARTYATSPQCVPARLSWTTGSYASRLGITTHRNVDLPGDAPSIVRTLRSRGWWTELVGKSHLTAHVKGRDLRDQAPRMQALGFDRVLEIAGPRGLRHVECALTDAWREAGVLERHRADLEQRYAGGRQPESWEVRPTVLPLDLYPDIWLAQRAAERIATLPTDRPWLLWVSFVGPHEPFDTPHPWAGRHAGADLPPASATPPWIASLPRHASAREARARWESLTPEAIDACRRDYADQLQLLDDQLGLLMETLDRRPDARRTTVALTADHGELLGDGGMLYKGTFLEGAVRVPWIQRPAPDEHFDAPRRTERPVGITPLLSSCFENLAAGGSTADLIEESSRQDEVCCEFADELMVVDGGRKIVVDRRGKALWAIDLDRDPREQENVVTDHRRTWRTDPGWRTLLKTTRRLQRDRRRRSWRSTQLKDVR